MSKILPDLTAESHEQIVARLMAENAALRGNQKAPRKLSLKVAPKGGVQLNGLRRFPVTLYKTEWEQVIAMVPEIKAFIAANSAVLAIKG